MSWREQSPEKYLSDAQESFIARKLDGSRLLRLAKALGPKKLEPSDISDIEDEQLRRKNVQAASKTMELWKNRNGRQATKQVMIEALINVEATNIADELGGGDGAASSDGTLPSQSSAVTHHDTSDLSRRPSTDDILKVVETLSEDWNLVGLTLGVKDEVLSRIVQDERTVSKRVLAMLRHWLNSTPGPTVRQLCEALDKYGKYSIAEKLGYKRP